jgi:hypothetical protein
MAIYDSTAGFTAFIVWVCVSRHSSGFRDDIADGGDRLRARGRTTPGRADHAVRRRRRERSHDEPASRGERALGSEPRKKGDAEAGRDHLPERLETRRAKILVFRADTLADFGRLVTQAVPPSSNRSFSPVRSADFTRIVGGSVWNAIRRIGPWQRGQVRGRIS